MHRNEQRPSRSVGRRPVLAALGGAAFVELGGSGLAGAESLRSRHEFAAAMAQLEEGMPKSEVVRLLSKPEDVRTEYDPGGILSTGTQEIWRYGTNGHLTTATLGEVSIGTDGKVQYVFGKGDPPAPGLFEEAQLRSLLRTLDEVPSYGSGLRFDPLKVVRAVNKLQPLGKARAIAAMREYLRIASWLNDGKDGIFLVLRTLFELPKSGEMPPMFVGAPSPGPGSESSKPARYPIALRGDFPLLVVSGYMLAGRAQHPIEHLREFEKWGVVRSAPLRPGLKPFDQIAPILERYPWLQPGIGVTSMRRILDEQVLRSLATVYPAKVGVYGQLLPYSDDAAYQKIIAEASAIPLAWDEKSSRYTRADGSVIPAKKKKIYRRSLWKPEGLKHADLEVAIERETSKWIDVTVRTSYHRAAAIPRSTIRVFVPGEKPRTLATIGVGGALKRKNSTTVTSRGGIELAEGEKAQVEFSRPLKKSLSPIFEPGK